MSCLIKITFFIIPFIFSLNTYAVTEVTPATGGTNICFGGGYVSLGDIRIAEGNFNDFASSPSSVTYEISSPADFEFEPGIGTVTAIGNKITGLAISVTSSTITINYTLTTTEGGPIDGFIIKGIRVLAINNPNFGEILRTGGTAIQNGNPYGGTLNHGTLISDSYTLPVADAGTNATIYFGNSTTIGGSPSATGTTPFLYEWSPATGLSNTTIANPLASPTTTTTYTLIITDGNGCTDSDQVEITVDQNIPIGPTITTLGATTFCMGESVILYSSESSGNQWYKDGNLISGANDPELFVNSPGTYQVRYHDGLVNSQLSDPEEVIVHELPNDVNLDIQDDYLCSVGTTLVEILISESNVNYQLIQGTTNIGTAKNGNGSSIFLPTGSLSPGNYTFNVRATHNTTLCIRDLTQTVSVQVEPSLTAPVLSASPSNAVCGATNITLSADLGFDEYRWYKNNLFILNSTVNTLELTNTTESGLYKVKGLLNAPVVCESDFSNEIDVKLQPLPQQKPITVAEELICKGSTTHVIIAGSEVGVIYNLRYNINNELIGAGIAGTGGTIFLPVGILLESTNLNILATNASTGCSIQMNDLATVSVNPDIIGEATTDNEELCYNGIDTIVLKSSATGGTGVLTYSWSGPNGFSSNLQDPEPFLPQSTGSHQYEVMITDETNCKVTKTIQVLVNALPTVFMTNTTEDNIICHGDNVRFSAFGAVEYEFYIDEEIVQAKSTNNIYRINTLSNGQTIKVIGYNHKGCSSESTEQVITVNPNPPSFFTGLNSEYCINDGRITLTGMPSEGVFSGNGIKGNEFIPEFAGIGSHIIKYTTTSLSGCDSTYSLLVLVKNSPTADFTFTNVCDGIAMIFQDVSTPSEEINLWEWDFGDGSAIATNQHPNHIFPGPGKYLVTLKVTSAYGCFNSTTKQVIVGAIPQPDFTFNQLCEGVTTTFTNKSSSGIISYSWNFGDPSSGSANTSNLENPGHIFSGVGSYNVLLTVNTELCTEIISKTVHILPSIGVNQFPYHENFEANNGGWVTGGQNSSWMHSMPSGKVIKTAGSGSYAWSTQANGGTYFDNEQSFVLSPCFDFTNLVRPMLSMQIWSHTDKGIDGTVMQYSLDNGVTWLRLGNIGEGLEWYNQGSIISQPGGNSIGQEGWSIKDTGWRTARFNLDFLKNEPSVRFRIAFGSVPFNGNRAGAEGFSFDNVWIGERSRLIVLEHFTNASKSENEEADKYVNDLTSKNTSDIISLHYHTDRPQTTPINLDNTADPSARSQYYGISQTPRAVLDGNFFNGKSTDWNIKHLKYRSLVEPSFHIQINLPETTNDQIEVNAIITSKIPLSQGMVVHIAVIEEEFFRDGKIHKNVVKKLLPDGAGTSLNEQWQEGTIKTINVNWNVTKMYVEGQPLKVVVYVQNNATKEILQANYAYTTSKRNSIPTSVLDDQVISLTNKLKVYPVPTDKELFCTFDSPLERKFVWKISDLRGISLGNGTLNAGTSELTIDTSHFPEGVYFLQLASDKNDQVVRKIIVKH